ncbi:HNH endonuclease [Pontibacillus chungwhensis]|uniref:HNH endonuclease n=2 Tax=Pontibacillus TaxID=289201 RepID=A0ABY8UYQ8_9BACI|nr:HNH endonuclease [Pontibacillus chungwhensis]WIF98495.1 HNH endonuclease [Pontibacillus chungwhensis]
MQKKILCVYCLKQKHRTKVGEHPIPDSCGSDITTVRVCKECNGVANNLVDSPFTNMKYIEFIRSVLGITTKEGVIKTHQQKVNFNESSGNRTTGKITIGKEGSTYELHPKVINNPQDLISTRFFLGQDHTHHIKAVIKKAQKSNITPVRFNLKKSVTTINGSLKYEVDGEIIRKELIKAMYALATIYLNGFEYTKTGCILRKYWKGEGILSPSIKPEFQLAVFNGLNINEVKNHLNTTSHNHLFSCVKEKNGDILMLLNLFGMLTVAIRLLPKCSKEMNNVLNNECKSIIINPVTRESLEMTIF